jgi:3-oxoacyl-[acyl-carrier protein] reductase
MKVLEGKAAIVTGSGRGIGLATASLLAEHGAQVVVNDLDSDVAAAAADSIGGDAVPVAADLTADDACNQLVEAAVGAFGRLDIIVNNAGYVWDGPVHKMSDEQFRAMLEIHTVAPFRMLRAAAPYFRDPAKAERAEGVEVFRKVVNVTSIAGTMGSAGQVNYAAGKAGVVGLTKTLAKEWGPLKVNVNAIAFGFIDTRMTAPRDQAETFTGPSGETIPMGTPDALRGAASSLIPLGRSATPEEAAGAVFLLCSPWSNYVHGHVLNATGGFMAGMGD